MLGSEMFLQLAPVEGGDAGFERLLARVDSLPATTASSDAEADAQDIQQSTLPKALHKITRGNPDNLQWRRLGRNFRYSNLPIDPDRVTNLLHIKAGCSLPHHRHNGDEITVVIKGSFSDHDDKYNVGDFIVRTSGEQHRPVASQDEDCLCLSTLDSPIVMTNWFYRILQSIL